MDRIKVFIQKHRKLTFTISLSLLLLFLSKVINSKQVRLQIQVENELPIVIKVYWSCISLHNTSPCGNDHSIKHLKNTKTSYIAPSLATLMGSFIGLGITGTDVRAYHPYFIFQVAPYGNGSPGYLSELKSIDLREYAKKRQANPDISFRKERHITEPKNLDAQFVCQVLDHIKGLDSNYYLKLKPNERVFDKKYYSELRDYLVWLLHRIDNVYEKDSIKPINNLHPFWRGYIFSGHCNFPVQDPKFNLKMASDIVYEQFKPYL